MYTRKTYANCSASGGEWQSWSTQLTILLKAAEQTTAVRTGLTQCVNVQMIQTVWNEAQGAARSQQDKIKRRKTYREHQENPPAHEKYHPGTHLRQETMHKIAVMNHLSLQEWRVLFYSQTERISMLVLGFVTPGVTVLSQFLKAASHYRPSSTGKDHLPVCYVTLGISALQPIGNPKPVCWWGTHWIRQLFSTLLVVLNNREAMDEKKRKQPMFVNMCQALLAQDTQC